MKDLSACEVRRAGWIVGRHNLDPVILRGPFKGPWVRSHPAHMSRINTSLNTPAHYWETSAAQCLEVKSAFGVCPNRLHRPIYPAALWAWKTQTNLEKFFQNGDRHGPGFWTTGTLRSGLQRLSLSPLNLRDTFQFAFKINETADRPLKSEIQQLPFFFSVKSAQ